VRPGARIGQQQKMTISALEGTMAWQTGSERLKPPKHVMNVGITVSLM